MLVVVGSRHDPNAAAIVQRWERWDATLLSCADLCTPGWRYSSSAYEDSRAVLDGQIVCDTDIRGVLVRRPCILSQELTHIAPGDREFVAAEMNALLVAWLARLRCCVLNRPRGMALCGPGWRQQEWAMAAARIGMEPSTTCWETPTRSESGGSRDLSPAEAPRALVVVGDRCFGDGSEAETAGARRLAATAGVGLLGVWVAQVGSGSRFVGATPMPSLSDLRLTDAVGEYLLSRVA